jgi:ligand-binding sensor domain-containing protein/AraC-like DNA-binding protein
LSVLPAQDAFFRTVSVEDGLSNNFIRKIYKNNRGYIWLGTLNGLDRFDGLSFKSYINNQYQMGNVYDLLETSPDFLWVATDHGLWQLNYDDEQLYQVDLADDVKVFCLKKGSGNQLLAGTSQGLFILSEKTSRHILPDESRSSNANTVWGIYADNPQSCWLATTSGLYHCNYSDESPQIIRYQRDGNQSYWSVAAIGANLFLGTHGDGLIKFDIRSGLFTKYMETDIGNDNILYLSSDGNDHLWVGTDGNGLKKISVSGNTVMASYIHRPQDPFSINSNAIYAFLEDQGILWIGSFSSGLSYSIKKVFHTYSYGAHSTRNNHIRSFALREHEKFLGTRDGFIYINEDKQIIRTYQKKQPGCEFLYSNTIISVFPFEGKYLLGTIKGLSVFDPENLSISQFHHDPIFKTACFYSFTTDRNKRLWMATFNGVICFTPSTDQITRYTTANSSLNQNLIHSLKEDSTGRIWIGTSTGVCFYDPKTDAFQSVPVLPTTINNCKITCIYEDRNANIWFCTENDGLYSVNSKLTQYEHYSTDNHLPDKSVSSIMEDDLGFFWVATHKGLVRCTFADNRCHTFWLSDGLPGLMFNPGACYYDRQGNRLWWGNENGLVYGKLKDIHTENTAPPVQLTHFYVNGKEVSSTTAFLPKAIDRSTKISLSGSQNSIGFDFIALNYIYPNDNVFETLLDGYEDNWNLLNKGKTTTQYSDLRPGKYVFHVRLAGFPESERNIEITVKRSWATLFLLIPFVILLVGWWWSWKKVKAIYKQKTDGKQKTLKKELPVKEYHLKDSQSKQQALLQLMEDKKPHLDPELKISYLATALKCTPAELSQIINTLNQQNFSDFVNTYRVDEFKQKIIRQEHKKYTILALSEQCGFNSRSSFFRIFKKIVGVTPTEYLKNND